MIRYATVSALLSTVTRKRERLVTSKMPTVTSRSNAPKMGMRPASGIGKKTSNAASTATVSAKGRASSTMNRRGMRDSSVYIEPPIMSVTTHAPRGEPVQHAGDTTSVGHHDPASHERPPTQLPTENAARLSDRRTGNHHSRTIPRAAVSPW